jgi:hypothetical protein
VTIKAKPTAFICDVDGTLADMGKGPDGKPLPGRRGPYDWDRVSEDTPIWPVIYLVQCLRRGGAHRVLFVSGRDEVCRERTQNWLDDTVQMDVRDVLFMRAHKDNRPDHEVKLEIYRERIEPRYDVRWVIDDRDQVVKAWRSLGLTVLQVADGDF